MLKELENTVVKCPTRSEYEQLYDLLEKDGWTMIQKEPSWNYYKDEEISINVGSKKVQGYARTKFYEERGDKIISLSEFKKIQGLEPRPFQVGDRVLHKYEGKGVIVKIDSNIHVKLNKGPIGSGLNGAWTTSTEYLELLSPCEEKEEQKEESTVKSMKKGIMSYLRDIPNKLKRVLNPGLQARYQLNQIDGEMEMTSQGREALLNFLEEKHEKELGELAIAEVKRLKKLKKKDCEE